MAKKQNFYELFINRLLGINPIGEVGEEVAQTAVVEKFDKDGGMISKEVTTLTPSSKEEFFGERKIVPSSKEEFFGKELPTKTKKVIKSGDGSIIEESVTLEPSSKEEFFGEKETTPSSEIEESSTADWLNKMHKK